MFEHVEDGIHSELTVFVALDAPVKFSVLKISNRSGRPRRLSVTGYVEWVLGDLRAKSAMHVTTEIDSKSGALYARNPYNTEFAEWVGFFDVDDPARTVTGDRTEFLGRNGTLRNPAALRRTRLSGRVGAALDPCAAMQVTFDLRRGAGARDRVPARRRPATSRRPAHWSQRFRGVAIAREALEAVSQHWRRTLGAVQVETPDAALNVLTNGWLVYQTMACRLWARSGYYQSGGAYGFRDQLQDVMALIHTEPRRCVRKSCWPRAASSSRATCSTGGIRPRAAASARTARTTICGCRWPPAAMCLPPATLGARRERRASSRAGPSTRKTTRTTTCRCGPTRAPTCISTAFAQSSMAFGSASMACR